MLQHFVAERIGERLHASFALDLEAVEVEQDVELPQGELAVAVEQGETDHPQAVAPQRACIKGGGREWHLVRAGWTPSPPSGHGGPERAVQLECSVDQGSTPIHPVDRLRVERIERIDHVLTLLVDALTGELGEAGCATGNGVAVVVPEAG